MGLGVAAAIAAAMLYNLAVVVQKSQAEKVADTGFAILAPLLLRPLWLLGVGLQVVGLGLHSFALTEAPVAVVQPIIASGIAFLVLFAALVLHERPTAREIVGMLLAVCGVGVVAMRFDGPAALRPVAALDLGFAIASAGAVTAALLCASRHIGSIALRAAVLGGAAGMGQGMSDAMNRLASAWLSPHRGWIPTGPIAIAALLALFAFGVQGFVSAQNAFQRYRANTVVPCMIAAQLFVPIAVAITLFGQSAARDAHGWTAWSAALSLTLAGVALLSRAAGVDRAFDRGGAGDEAPLPPADGGAL